MADSVARLLLQDNMSPGIKRASDEMRKFEEQMRKAGDDMSKASGDAVKYVQSLGSMESKAKSTKGRLSEMSNAFVELSQQYKRLSDAEKQSPFGQALSKSLQQLKTKITETKASLEDAQKQLNGVGDSSDNSSSALEQLAEKFGLSSGKAVAYAAAAAAVAGGLKVAHDAFFNNEEQLDAWGRTVEAAGSAYRGFLDAINNGDISGYLSRIDEIIKAAEEAYDAQDALGTFNAFNQMNEAKARAAFSGAIVDYREGKKSREDVIAARDAYKGQLEQRRKYQEDAYNAKIREYAAERGIAEKDLRDALSGEYGTFDQLKAIKPTGKKTKTVLDEYGKVVATYEVDVAVGRLEKLGAALRRFNDVELDALQAIGTAAFNTSDEINKIDKQALRYLNAKTTSSAGGGTASPKESLMQGGVKGTLQQIGFNIAPSADSLSSLNSNKKYWQNVYNNATNSYTRDNALSQVQKVTLEIADIKLTQRDALVQKVNEEMKGLTQDIQPLEIEAKVDNSKVLAQSWQSAAQAISAVGGALQQIDDPAAKVFGIIAQAVANVAAGFAGALARPESQSGGVWGWIAAAAAGLGTMISTISAIKSATAGSYAEGGIVGGNYYSGDRLTANVNSGELILNRAQQTSIASQLSAPRQQTAPSSQPYLTGEMIYLGLNNYTKRTGRGEIMTSR